MLCGYRYWLSQVIDRLGRRFRHAGGQQRRRVSHRRASLTQPAMVQRLETRKMLAGEQPQAIEGYVYVDANDNGLKDNGEAGIPGVTITLTGTDYLGNVVFMTRTTDASGYYLFDGPRQPDQIPLFPGTYRLRETQPAGYFDGQDTKGNITPIPGSYTTDTITGFSIPNDGVSYEYKDNNFGELPPSSLSGYTYVDANNDGTFQGTETPIPGVLVTLTGINNLGNPVTATTTTDSTGKYSFTNLRPGTYQIAETQPAAYLDGKDTIGTPGGATTNDFFSAIALPAGFNGLDNNFGELPPGTISGKVYADDNDDGTPNGLETGIPGVTLTLTGTDDLGNSVTLATTTDGNGDYSFTNLRPGTYTVTETPPAGYFDGLDANGGAVIPGSRTTDLVTPILLGIGDSKPQNNFGELLPASIAGYVYVDANNDGTFQGTEAPISGVTVTLTGTDNTGAAVFLTTTTNGSGAYSFTNLRPGTYQIAETQPAAYLDGKDTIGTPGGATTNDFFSAIALPAGFNGLDNNFGELPPASLAGFVYADVNNDGIKQGTEAGIGGVLVTLTGTNDLGNPVTLTTTTAANGAYSFTNLRPGTYRIAETQPAAYVDGKDTIGTPGGTTANDVFSAIILVAGFNGVDNNFGELSSGSISGTKYLDISGNGYSADDTPMAGATFTLYLDKSTGSPGVLDANDTVVGTVTSLANGTFSFGNLAAGKYFLKENPLAGYIQTGPATLAYYTVNVTAGSSNPGYIFANAELGCECYIDTSSISYKITNPATGTTKTVSDLRGNTNQGDTVQVKFYVTNPGGTFSLVSYTAPGPSFDPNTAYQQVIFDVDTVVNAPVGWNTLTVLLPNCNYQVDFVCGLPIDTFGPAGSNIFYTPQERLFSADNDGTQACAPSSLSGFTYYDANNNGVKDSGEAGIAGTTVTLTGTDIFGNPVSRTTTTSSSGAYNFSNLPASAAGGYTITNSQAVGYLDGKDTVGSLGGTAGNDVLVTAQVNTNSNGINYNFGEILAASVSGFVYVDTNNDGVKQSAETVLSGVTVKLTGTDDRGNAVSLTTTTNSSGLYQFTTLRPGTYTITETQPAGYIDGQETIGSQGGTAANNVFSNVVLNAGTAGVNNNFGEQLVCGSLSGYVYSDANNDGVKQSTETAISGVTIKLTGTDVNGNAVSKTTTTNSSGYYEFTNLVAGTYVITETQPSGYLDGKDTIGSQGGTKSNDKFSAIALTGGVAGVNNNFGELLAASVSGYVYVDSNNDGVKQSSEAVISSVTVKLTGTDDLGNAVSLSTTTNSAGLYQFTTLRPGTYTITETQPAGYVDGKETIGSQGGTASNNVFTNVVLKAGTAGVNNNFGELGACLTAGDTATIGYWANSNGQALIKCLNGGSSSTALAKWLATTYPNLYGASAGSKAMVSSSGVYKTNSQVASIYINKFFNGDSPKTDAQVLAAALATYVTNSTLAGSNVAASYGFTVTSTGTGSKFFNVGSNGGSFGVADNTSMTILQMLAYANSKSANGVLYSTSTSLLSEANVAFTSVNQTGDIANTTAKKKV